LMALSRDSCFLSISSEACVSSLVFTGCVHVGVLEIEILELQWASTVQKRRFQMVSVPRFAGRSSRRQLDPHGGWPPCLLGLWSDGSLEVVLCFAFFLIFLFVSACFSCDLLHSTLCLEFLLGTHLPYS
jgi:hypothetical protein